MLGDSRGDSGTRDSQGPSGTADGEHVLAATLCSQTRTLSSTKAEVGVDIAAIRGMLLLSPAPACGPVRLDWGLGVKRARAPSRQRSPSRGQWDGLRSEGAARALFLSRFIRVGIIYRAHAFVLGEWDSSAGGHGCRLRGGARVRVYHGVHRP